MNKNINSTMFYNEETRRLEWSKSLSQSSNHKLGVIIHLNQANVEVGRKIGRGKWCYRLAIGAATGNIGLLQEGF